MNKAFERRLQKEKVMGAIQAFRFDGASDETIITKVMTLFDVTEEYVLALLTPEKA